MKIVTSTELISILQAQFGDLPNNTPPSEGEVQKTISGFLAEMRKENVSVPNLSFTSKPENGEFIP